MVSVTLYEVERDFRGYDQFPYFGKEEVPAVVYRVAEKVFSEVDGAHCVACECTIGFYIEDGDYGQPKGGFTYFWVVYNEIRDSAWAICEDCTVPVDYHIPDDSKYVMAE